MNDDIFWTGSTSEEDDFKLGETLPPVDLYLSAIDIAKLNSKIAVFKKVMLHDGNELELHIYLDVDRRSFGNKLREVVRDAEAKDSS